ncbi:MAG: hypothetical protein EOO75_17745, partial [Myxococcales bacterium]
MSYHVSIHRREVQARYEAAKDPSFFEDVSSLPHFTAPQRQKLTRQLAACSKRTPLLLVFAVKPRAASCRVSFWRWGAVKWG